MLLRTVDNSMMERQRYDSQVDSQKEQDILNDTEANLVVQLQLHKLMKYTQ